MATSPLKIPKVSGARGNCGRDNAEHCNADSRNADSCARHSSSGKTAPGGHHKSPGGDVQASPGDGELAYPGDGKLASPSGLGSALEYWKSEAQSLPAMSSVALLALAVPVTSVCVERLCIQPPLQTNPGSHQRQNPISRTDEIRNFYTRCSASSNDSICTYGG
ncbi:UNVERIFIED_CONTAM: hypothetical protein FKN15_078465 [Acipenser sinensis]